MAGSLVLPPSFPEPFGLGSLALCGQAQRSYASPPPVRGLPLRGFPLPPPSPLRFAAPAHRETKAVSLWAAQENKKSTEKTGDRLAALTSLFVLLHSKRLEMISLSAGDLDRRKEQNQKVEASLTVRPLQSSAGAPATRQPPCGRCAASLRPKGDWWSPRRFVLFGLPAQPVPSGPVFICDGGSRCLRST